MAYDLRTTLFLPTLEYHSDQMNPPGPSPQPGVIPRQNTQGQPTWIPGTRQNPTLGSPGQSSPPPGVQQSMGSRVNVPQRVSRRNTGNAMTAPQQQSNQNRILTPPSVLQTFARTAVPPLERACFQRSYQHFRLTKKLVINEAMLNIGGKQVDLHAIHREVLKLRTTGRVSFVSQTPSLHT